MPSLLSHYRVFSCLLALTLIGLTGCSDGFDSAGIKRLRGGSQSQPQPRPPSKVQTRLDGNSQGGLAVPATSNSYVMPGGAVGGSPRKSVATSSSYKVTGGIHSRTGG